MNQLEFCVTKCLPCDGETVLCFGHHTYCCKVDMDELPDWHEVTFRFVFSKYKLKKEIPSDPEESILEYYNCVEDWKCGPEVSDGRIIGVTKWKKIL